ncbi:hypothetical protein C7974DRAFT_351196 [Boeremia exigua]|uniref:uncharacterized protein n=1 Tax=Boeremia exigua TaxID=749465 RepID=UPI001E8ECAD5|nr:uncharacterized protein C7974DRAFT_351196 [Boeremia exigua]KAH6642540.1 hypothetical protein C7974DRAFT_351196 [Boeremia exigua]
MRVIAALFFIVSPAWTVYANVEKTIFLGPSAVTLPDVRPSLDSLRLQSLSSLEPVLPTRLSVQFPTRAEPHGLESWYLLSGLEEGRRYEARICWPATSPTNFWLDTYSLDETFATPELVSSLASYSDQLWDLAAARKTDNLKTEGGAQSILFLRIQAAASYYSTNRTLMDDPPPVDVDIILDPFLFNVLPHSLAPVAIYIVIVAAAAWFVSGYTYNWLRSVAEATPSKAHSD